jgi:hypothetical protein
MEAAGYAAIRAEYRAGVNTLLAAEKPWIDTKRSTQ